MAGLTDEEFAAWVIASCERSGVPAKIADIKALRDVAVLLHGRAGRHAAQRLAADRPNSDAPDEIDS